MDLLKKTSLKGYINMLILGVKINGEKVTISYENEKKLEIEILLKTYIEFPFSIGQEIEEINFKKMLKKEDIIL